MGAVTARVAGAGYRDVLRLGEFRVLWLAQAQSRLGDQLARVGLAVLVYGRTGSAVLTALVYALTFLPPLVTAPLLAGLADRFPRRRVLAGTDLARGGLVGLMAVPGVPLAIVLTLLVAMVCLQPLFAAARNGVLAAALPGDRYQVGMGLVSTTDYVAQIGGFLAGGGLVALLGGPRMALVVDAATFTASALLVWRGIGEHRPATAGPVPRRGFALAGVRLLSTDRRLVGLGALMWLYGFFIAPEAVAAPYAHQLGAGPATVGLLMAADPAGAVIGAVAVTRLIPVRLRQRLMMPLAVATGIPLALSAVHPSVPASVLLWAATGALASYLVLAQTTLVRAVPDVVRGRVMGTVSAGLQTAQGAGVLLAGALAQWLQPSTAVALCGLAGTLAAILIGLAFHPSNPIERPTDRVL